MCSVRLVLGMERLGEVDDGALPPLRTLCRALDMRTHWSESEATFYIESPATGRNVAVLPEPANLAVYATAVEQIVTMLTERLKQAGAHVCAAPHEAHLALRIAVGAHTAPGVASTYPWSTRQSLRTLADLITAEVAREAALPDLGAKASLMGGRSLPVPWLQVGIGRPDRESGVLLQDPAFCRKVADGIFIGLCRHWAGPLLAEVCRYLPNSRPQFAAGQPEPKRAPTLEPALVLAPRPEVEPAPQLMLEPIPEPIPESISVPVAGPATEPIPEAISAPVPEPVPEPDPDARLVLAPAMATVTEIPRPAPAPPPPAKPQPAPLRKRPAKPPLPPLAMSLIPLSEPFTRTPPAPLPSQVPPQLPPVVPPQLPPPSQPPLPAANRSVMHMFQWVGRPAKRVHRGAATVASFQQRPKK